MKIERIFTRPKAGGPQVAHQAVRIVAGAGIDGDRYFGAHEEPGQNITFVEAEEIERFAAEHRCVPDFPATGRNVVTRGVRLNELVGREFGFGPLRFRGVELCEPCSGFGEALSSAALPPSQVVKHWIRRAGLRADALTSGELVVGAAFHHVA